MVGVEERPAQQKELQPVADFAAEPYSLLGQAAEQCSGRDLEVEQEAAVVAAVLGQ